MPDPDVHAPEGLVDPAGRLGGATAAHPPTFDLTDDHDGPYRDPTDDELVAAAGDKAAAGEPAPLDDIAAELAVDLSADAIRLDIEGRPGWVAVYRRDFAFREVEAWRKAAKRGARRDPDMVLFAGTLVARTMIGLERAGKPVLDDDYDPVTVTSPWLQDQYGVDSAVECGRRLFGGDGFLNGQANAVLDRAGYRDEVDDADPT